jgi:hypothetical protein
MYERNRNWSGPPAYADPYPQFNPFGQRAAEQPRIESGGSAAFCVRTCDGRYFPIARNTGATAAQTCSALCPAATTKIYHGSSIDNASANGQRYADLNTAFVYREKIVPGCTCNGRDAFGIVTPSVNGDPTLHTGDIVATNNGLVVAVTGGGRKQAAEFTPIESYTGLPAELRQRLSETKVVPSQTAPVTVPVKPVETTASIAVNKNKRAQVAPHHSQHQQQQHQQQHQHQQHQQQHQQQQQQPRRWWFW